MTTCGHAQRGAAIEPLEGRYAALIQFTLLTVATSMSDVVHTVLIAEFQPLFGVPMGNINILNALYLACYVVAGPFTTRAFTWLGLRRAMLLASALNLVGCVLKTVAVAATADEGVRSVAWWMFVAGQVLVACGINFAMAGPTVLSAAWFGPTERSLATSIVTQADSVGIAVGALYPVPLYVLLQSWLGVHGNRQRMVCVFGAMVLLAVIDTWLNVCVVRTSPVDGRVASVVVDSSSSESVNSGEDAATHHHRMASGGTTYGATCDRWESAADGVELRHDEEPTETNGLTAESYVKREPTGVPTTVSIEITKLVIGGALTVSVFWAHAPLFVELLLPYGFSEGSASLLSGFKIIVGMIPATYVAVWIDRTREYKRPLVGLALGALLCYAALVVALPQLPHLSGVTLQLTFALVCGLLLSLGACQNAIAGVVFEYLIEASYPFVREDVTAGLFMWLTHALGTGFLLLASHILKHGATERSTTQYLNVLVWTSAVSVVVLLTVRRRYRRRDAELLS